MHFWLRSPSGLIRSIDLPWQHLTILLQKPLPESSKLWIVYSPYYETETLLLLIFIRLTQCEEMKCRTKTIQRFTEMHNLLASLYNRNSLHFLSKKL